MAWAWASLFLSVDFVHLQRWQREQLAPSLQPLLLKAYLHAAAQLSGCPTEPRETLQPSWASWTFVLGIELVQVPGGPFALGRNMLKLSTQGGIRISGLGDGVCKRAHEASSLLFSAAFTMERPRGAETVWARGVEHSMSRHSSSSTYSPGAVHFGRPERTGDGSGVRQPRHNEGRPLPNVACTIFGLTSVIWSCTKAILIPSTPLGTFR